MKWWDWRMQWSLCFECSVLSQLFHSLAFLMIQRMLAIWSLVSLSFLKSAWVDHKEGWTPRNWCFQIVVLEKTLESPLDSKEIKPVNPKGNQHWIFIGKTDAESETPILWPPNANSRLVGKDPDAGKDWRQKKKGTNRMRWLDSITDSVHMDRSKLLQEIVEDRRD